MARPHPTELRQRVVGFVELGHSHRETARIFQVSVRFVNNMVLLKARTGDLVSSPQGGWRSSKLAGHESFVLSRIDENGDLTLDDLRKELEERGVVVHRSSVGRLLARHKRSLKKTVVASERLRPDVSHRRDFWIAKRLPAIGRELHRVVFIDETSTNTSMTKTTGWSPVGERYYGYAPLGHHLTQTFIAGLRSFAMVAPWLVDAPMNKPRFEFYLEHELAPTLNKGEVVILDNLPVHKSLRAEEIIRDQGAWMLFLPPYSPDLNPIEMAFAKLKAYLRKAAARSIDAICDSLTDICNMFDPIECRNYFRAAGYEFI